MSKQLEAVVSIAGSISPSLEKSIKSATDKLGGLNLKAIAIGAAAGAATVAIGKAVFEAGEYLADLGGKFDEVEDTIRIGTGATGDALDGLLDSFDAVYSSVPTTMEDASKAISDYNTRLGLTGDQLEGISAQAIQVADMLGEDLGGVIESSSQAFQNWDIAAENMGDAMDYVFKVSQSTGVGFSDLMGQLQSSGAILQECGYSFEDAATLLGQVEKAGYDSSTVLTALNKAAKKAASDGFDDMTAGIDSYIDAILNAESSTEAYNIAVEVFGTKGAATMVEAIESGALSLQDLEAELMASSETISGAAEDTYDFAEMLQLLKQKGEIALKPLANAVFQMINDLMPVLSEAMEGVIPIIESMTETLVPIVEQIVPSILPLLQELIPSILEMAAVLLEELIPPIVEIMTSLLPVVIQLIQLITPLLKTIITAVLPVIVKLIQQILPILIQIISSVLPVITQLLEELLPVVGQIIDAILPVIIQLLETLLPVIMQIIDAVLPVIIQLLDTIVPIALQIINAILPVVIELINALLPILTTIIEAVLPVLIEVLNVLTPILDLIIALLQPILDLFVMLVEPILNLIMTAIQPLIDIFTVLITSILQPVMPILSAVAEVITGVLGAAIQSIAPLIEGLTSIFQGLIDFITGVFSGNWSQAWDGIVQVFGGLWDGLVAIVKAPINAVIGLINGAINALNKVSVTIPDWVPVVGGQTFGINIPNIPLLASGGFTEGISIAGEAGTEAVISFDRAYRSQNIGYWMEAGERLDAFSALAAPEESYTSQAGKLVELDDFSLSELAGDGGVTIIYDFSGFTWSPTVEGSGDNEDDIMARLKEHEAEFFDWLEEFIRMREVSSFA